MIQSGLNKRCHTYPLWPKLPYGFEPLREVKNILIPLTYSPQLVCVGAWGRCAMSGHFWRPTVKFSKRVAG